MSTQLIFSNLLHIRKKNEADSVEKCFGFFFFQSSEKQLWSLLKPIAPSNVTSCLLQCFLRSQVATKPLWSRYKSHTITTGKNALWGKKKTELEMTM